MFQQIRASLVLLAILAPAPLAQARSTPQSFTPANGEPVKLPAGSFRFNSEGKAPVDEGPFARLDAVDWSGWKDLQSLLEDVHRTVGIPALAAAFVRDGKVIAQATVGVQEFGSDLPVTTNDRFHLGSVSKSFTATLIGKLIEEGKLSWDSTIGEILGAEEMLDAYREVSLEQLLGHRGGFPAYTQGRPVGHPRDKRYSGTPTEKRRGFLADVLQQPPVAKPGEAMVYSNAGYAIAGHMAERATGMPWEQLIRRYIFKPLGMTQAGFGIPDHPVGHAGNGPEFHPVPMDAYPALEVIAPAGNIHCSIGDLARYALVHLAGLAGQDGLVSQKTMQRLHTPLASPGGRPYAGGWFIRKDTQGGPLHTHGGTVGASFAEVGLYPERRSATLLLTTVSMGMGEALSNRLSKAMLARFGPQSTGFISKSGEAQSGGLSLTKGSSTPAQDARLWKIIGDLAQALNNEDRKAYGALFSPNYDSYDPSSMFDFMAQSVLPMRGGVHSFHKPSSPMKAEGDDEYLRAVTFHLENGYPGYFGLTLDEQGLITEFSLFVKGDMCPNGADRQCDKISRRLDRDFK